MSPAPSQFRDSIFLDISPSSRDLPENVTPSLVVAYWQFFYHFTFTLMTFA
jgi:hypothetical protein